MSAESGVGVVSGPRPGTVEDNRLDEEALPERMQEALEADDFVIYGKASIEQYDTDDVPTLIEMDALEAALDRYFESETAPGVISLGHDDVIVGRPLREYELEDATTIQIGDESYEFAAGDTLEAHVADADEDGKRELWLPSVIDGETEMGKRMRLHALAGNINGYSVTVRRNEAESTEEGRRITACDLHAVTLGTDRQIKNKGSEFDVAEFKAAFGLTSGDGGAVSSVPDDAILPAVVEGTVSRMTAMSNLIDRLLGEQLEQKGKELQGDTEDGDGQAESSGNDASVEQEADDVPDDQDEQDDEIEEDAADIEELAQMVAQVTGTDVEQARAALEGLTNGGAPDGEGDGGEMKSDDASETKSDDESGAKPAPGVSEEELDQKLEQQREQFEQKLDEAREDFAEEVGDLFGDLREDVEEKLESGSTPTPSGGPTNDEANWTDQISKVQQRHGSTSATTSSEGN